MFETFFNELFFLMLATISYVMAVVGFEIFKHNWKEKRVKNG